jgi:hypothetical protein
MADLANGLFELIGASLICLSIRQILRDRATRGLHWGPLAFFNAWGWWNCYFYPSLGQWWSFAGGVAMVTVNSVYLVLVVRYWRR